MIFNLVKPFYLIIRICEECQEGQKLTVEVTYI